MLCSSGVFLAVSSTTSHQVINGASGWSITSSKTGPPVAVAFIAGVRFANNIYGGMQFADKTEWATVITWVMSDIFSLLSINCSLPPWTEIEGRISFFWEPVHLRSWYDLLLLSTITSSAMASDRFFASWSSRNCAGAQSSLQPWPLTDLSQASLETQSIITPDSLRWHTLTAKKALPVRGFAVPGSWTDPMLPLITLSREMMPPGAHRNLFPFCVFWLVCSWQLRVLNTVSCHVY